MSNASPLSVPSMATRFPFLLINDEPQGSEGWKLSRLGKITCSNLSKVLAKGEGKTRARYMRELAAELITGMVTDTYSNDHMQRGTEQEPIARELLALEVGEITECGFMYDPVKRAGVSLDGVYSKGLTEFKSAIAPIQIERLEKGTLPSEYAAQVMGGLWITQLPEAKFQSYCPGLPRMVVHVEPNPTYFQMLEDECGKFNKELDELVTKIKNLY